MPSDVKTPAGTPPNSPPEKPKFRTVLGLASPSKPSFAALHSPDEHSVTPPRPGPDAVATANQRRKGSKAKPDRNGAADDAFFEVLDPKQASPANLKNEPLPTRRAPLRMDAQDGPWSVSVAEHPHDKRLYTLYIKSELYCALRPMYPF